MSVWQQLAITDAWIQQHTSSTRFTVINQNPMLSPEPLGNSWCLSVNPLLPDNLVHVLTKPVSHDNLISPLDNETKAPIAEETREQAENIGVRASRAAIISGFFSLIAVETTTTLASATLLAW